MAYARVRKDITSDELVNPSDYWLYVELRDLEGQVMDYRPKTEWVMATCFDGMGTGLYVLTEDEDSYFTCHSIDLEFRDELPVQAMMPISKEQLIDWTNYDWMLSGSELCWVEDGQEIGVRVRAHEDGGLWVYNPENQKGLVIMSEELKKYGAILIDFVQFAKYWTLAQEVFAYADALLAMEADYGLSGSDMGLGVSLPYGAWLDYEGGTYRLWNREGMEYYASTPQGCSKAWKKLEAIRPQIEWAKAKREGK